MASTSPCSRYPKPYRISPVRVPRPTETKKDNERDNQNEKDNHQNHQNLRMALFRVDSERYRLENVTTTDVGLHRIESRSVSWNSDGLTLAMACSDRMARIVSASEGKEVQTIAGHPTAVDKVRFHPRDSHTLLTSGLDKTIRLWDVRHNHNSNHSDHPKATGTIHLQTGIRAISVEWSPREDIIVHTEDDATIFMHDVRDLTKPLHTFALGPMIIETCIVSPDGNYLVTGASSRSQGMADLRVWQWRHGQDAPTTLYPAHVGPVYAAAFAPDGRTLATGGADATVGLWNTFHLSCRHTVVRPSKFIRSVAFSCDSQLLATASEDEGIDIADAKDGTLVGTITFGHRGKGGGAEEVAFHPLDTRVVACARISQGPLPVPPVTIAKFSLETLP